mmetsp:Transcript_58936/g.140401  ORF Transcript_58936/g.140401 Transcript_58936/m.140401 type:complete len:319 (-) Transcript_58936:2203-3159(-)
MAEMERRLLLLIRAVQAALRAIVMVVQIHPVHGDLVVGAHHSVRGSFARLKEHSSVWLRWHIVPVRVDVFTMRHPSAPVDDLAPPTVPVVDVGIPLHLVTEGAIHVAKVPGLAIDLPHGNDQIHVVVVAVHLQVNVQRHRQVHPPLVPCKALVAFFVDHGHIVAVVVPVHRVIPVGNQLRIAAASVLVVAALVVLRSAVRVPGVDPNPITLDELAGNGDTPVHRSPAPAVHALNGHHVARRLHQPPGAGLHDVQVLGGPVVVVAAQDLGTVPLVVKDLHVRVAPAGGHALGPVLDQSPGLFHRVPALVSATDVLELIA